MNKLTFTQTRLKDAFVIEPVVNADERGHFIRTFCGREFEARGLGSRTAQANLSFNFKKGTLRGMHIQKAPHSEAKLVSCVRGAVHDIIVDLREGSPTYKDWFGIDLTEDNLRSLYVPGGFAHGYLTLEDRTSVSYLVSEFYTPGSETGLRHDDPALGLKWPIPPILVSDKDLNWPDLNKEAFRS